MEEKETIHITSIDRTDWKSYFGRIRMGRRVDRK